MNREQTSLNLPYNPTIQPAASPVDQFHAPIVNAPDLQNARDLQALGEGLAKLEPTVKDVFGQQFNAYVDNSKLQATRDRAEQRLDSMGQFRQAVNSGKINQSQNPWYAAQMEEEIGRVVANKATAAAWMEYEQTPDVRKSNDVNVVDKFFSDKFAKSIQAESGGSVWAAGAMSKVFDSAKTELLQRHVATRARELPEEREVAAKADIADILANYDDATHKAALAGDPAALATQVTAKTNLQSKLNDLLHTVDPITANKWVKEAVVDHALTVENADVAKELIGGLTTKDGKGLIVNDSDRAQMRHLYDRIGDIKWHRVELEEQIDRKTEKDTTKAFATIVQNKQADAKAKGEEFDFNTALTPDDLRKLPPNVVTNLMQTFSQTVAYGQQLKNVKQENARREIIEKRAADLVNGRLGPDEQVTFYDMLLQAGGHHDLATILQTKRMVQDMQWPVESDPAVLGQVASAIGRGEMSGQSGIDKLVSIATTNQQLSSRDFREFSFLLLGRMSRGDQSFDHAVMETGQATVSNLIRDKRIDSLGLLKPSDLPLDTVLLGSLNKARSEYLFAHEDMTLDPKWPTLSPAEKQQKTQDLIDAVAKKYGGYSYSESVTAEQKRVDKEEKQRLYDAQTAAANQQKKVVFDPRLQAVTDIGDPALKTIAPSIHAILNSSGVLKDQPNPDKIGWFQTPPTFSTPELSDLVFSQQWFNKIGTSQDSAALPGVMVVPNEPPPEERKASALAQLEQSRAKALVAAQALGRLIQEDNYAGRIQLTDSNIQHQTFATEADTANLRYFGTKLRDYAILRQRAGYSVEEVKQMGGDAYLKVPLFGSIPELLDKGADVGKQLGLTPQQAGLMMSAQRDLLEKLLNPS